MPEHEARVRAFYDHEAEEPRAGRRRRQIADWGVGEDVFDRLPSRRFSRVESAHARRAAEFAGAEPDAEWDASAPARPVADAPARPPRSEDDGPARPRRSEDDPPARPPRADGDAQPRPPWSDVDAPARPPRSADAASGRPRPIPRGRVDDGRRTIVIGEPREDYAPAAPRRPPRLAHERVGPRPDRIVAYAVGLGVLLILIAILSAGH
jgi:hypothetical protein